MLLYCRTDCCENLDFFLSLSKSTCNSIWSGINTVAQILCREWCIHLYLKKKKLGDYFGGRGAHDTAHRLQHIRCIKSCEYTWPIQLSFLCPKYNSWTEVVHSGVGVVLSLVCWHIQSCFFFCSICQSMNSHCRELDFYIQQFWIQLSIQYWVHFLLVVAIKILSHGIIILSTFGE